MVQYEIDRHPDFLPARWRGNLLHELMNRHARLSGRGSINGAGTSAHLAAHVIHAHVKQLSSQAQRLVISTAMKGEPPNWNPYIPGYAFHPVWKGSRGHIERINGKLVIFGNFRKIWSKKRQWIGCYIEAEGTPPAIAEAIREDARRNYSIWYDGLAKLETPLCADPRLAELTIKGVGVPITPWTRKEP